MLKTAGIFQSGMILQREKRIPLWGTGTPGEEVRIELPAGRWEGKADESGQWKVYVGPLSAAKSCTVKISSGEELITLQDVAVGDVYLAGGQSNMEFLMRYEKHFEAEREACENPHIRFYDVPEVCYEGQERDFDYSRVGLWRKADKENLDFFSAPGYYFAREVQRELEVPVGIIGLNWGGSRSLAWMSEEHARQICPEQVRDFEEKLRGQSYEEAVKKAGENPANDRGYSVWNPFDEFILPRTPSGEELAALFSGMPGIEDYAAQLDMKGYPGCLYEHMVKKAAPFGVKGALWYQGESDDELEDSSSHYEASLKAVISDWREAFQEKELPFFVVQLPGFRSWLQCVARSFPGIRRAQELAAEGDPYVYLCSISDAGEEWDIHPKDKRVVGMRLARLALKYLYGKDILADPPRPESVKREGSRIEISFRNAGEGLLLQGEKIQALQVAGEKGELPFACEAEGDTLVITLQEGKDSPVQVRFAQENWFVVNLYNSAGIPAVPFTVQC